MMKKTFLGLLMLFLGIDICNAAGLNFTGTLVENNGGYTPPGDTETPFSDWIGYTSGNSNYEYRYKKEIDTSTDIIMNAYNLNGESIIPYETTINPNEHTFKAGTWIGISVMEKQTATWGVYGFEYKEIKKRYTCNYQKQYSRWEPRWFMTTESGCNWTWATFYPYDNESGYGSCVYYVEVWYTDTQNYDEVVEYNTDYDCPTYYPYDSGYRLIGEPTFIREEIPIYSGYAVEQMKNQAVIAVHDEAAGYVNWSSGLVKYITNNSMPKDEDELEYNTIDSSTENTNMTYDSGYLGTTSGYITKSFDFLETKVCMNVKNAQVSYGRDCNDNEIKIENKSQYDRFLNKNVNIWHYFIPLNAKSNSTFSLEVVKNENRKFEVNECISFMTSDEHKDNYEDFITPISTIETDTFIGDYNRYSTEEDRRRYSADYKKLTDGDGCNISTKITFPIEQKFYNEKATINSGVEQLKFTGFNFYYKPIDVSEANTSNQFDILFPNGITRNWLGKITTPTLWEDWIESSTKTPDLSKSYTEKTYVATNINAKKIRDYNKTNQYTSWNNMYTTGVSKFIETEGIITRQVNQDSFYKLGCGPLNINEYLDEARTQKNNLYIRGCERS